MKIADYISKIIQEYPTLFKDVDYEKSKLKVLDHIFFTNGNGLELAKTENPKDGGYAVEDKMKKDKATGEWVRVYDKPYGKVKYKPLPKDYFDTVIYYVHSYEPPIRTIYKKNKYTADDVYYVYSKEIDNTRGPDFYRAESTGHFHPYPFSKGYSIVCDVFYDDVFLQDDWMEELVLLCKRTLEYFTDENQHKVDTYYPTKHQIQYDIKMFEDALKDGGKKGLKSLLKTWGYKPSETVPSYKEVENIRVDQWEKYKKDKIEFLNSFLKKYSKNERN